MISKMFERVRDPEGTIQAQVELKKEYKRPSLSECRPPPDDGWDVVAKALENLATKL